MLAVFQLEKLGGKERDCLAVADFLSRRGHEVTIVTTSAIVNTSARFVEILKVRGLFNHTQSRAFGQDVIEHYKASSSDVLVAFERIPGADFYYATDSAIASKGDILRWLPRSRARRALERGVFGNAAESRVFFLTDRQREEYERTYDFDRSRSVVLPLVLHRERFEAAKEAVDRAAVRKQLNLPQGAIVAISVALAPKRKGVDRALAAVASHNDLHLLLVGSENGWIKRQARRLGIEDRIRIVPYSLSIMQLLRVADFMLHPARLEAAGQGIVEAVLAGAPAVVTEICGYSSVIEQTGAGVVLAEPFSQKALNATVADIIERLSEFQEASAEAATQLYNTRCDWLSTIAQELELQTFPPRGSTIL